MSQAIALGINTIREIFSRIPLLYEEEEMHPLIQEIVCSVWVNDSIDRLQIL